MDFVDYFGTNGVNFLSQSVMLHLMSPGSEFSWLGEASLTCAAWNGAVRRLLEQTERGRKWVELRTKDPDNRALNWAQEDFVQEAIRSGNDAEGTARAGATTLLADSVKAKSIVDAAKLAEKWQAIQGVSPARQAEGWMILNALIWGLCGVSKPSRNQDVSLWMQANRNSQDLWTIFLREVLDKILRRFG